MISSDHPIATFDEDELNVRPFVDKLIKPLLEWPPSQSLVIGLYAPWGSGKSSTLNLLESALGAAPFKPRVLVARFNPWLYNDVNTLLKSFFQTIEAVTQSTPLLTTARKRSLQTSIRAISAFAVPVFAPLATAASGGIDMVTPASQGILAAVDSFLEGGELEFNAQKKKAASVLEKLGKHGRSARLVVLIDDLDRAEPAEVRAMLKLVRLVADLPNVTYVLAMDYGRVRELLAQSGGNLLGDSYLEKIVQVAVQLPPVSPDRLHELVVTGLNAVMSEPAKPSSFDITAAFEARNLDIDELLLWRLTTLRDKARFINAFRFLILASGERLEIDPVDAALVALIQVFYASLAERIQRNKPFVLGQESMRVIYRRISLKEPDSKKAREAAFNSLIDDSLQLNRDESELDPTSELAALEVQIPRGQGGKLARRQEVEALKRVLTALFPYVARIDHPQMKERRRWRLDNRIAAPERFERFFTFALSSDSVSDNEFNEWLDRATHILTRAPADPLSGSWPPLANNMFVGFAANSAKKRADFLEKLADRWEQLEKTGILANLATAVAYAGGADLLPDSDAANFIRESVSNVVGERYAYSATSSIDRERVLRRSVALEEQLHLAFSILIDGVPDPFDAVAAAGDYVNHWNAVKSDHIDSRKKSECPPELLPVLEAGLRRIHEAVSDNKDVFESSIVSPGMAVWRWRDLLKLSGESPERIKRYLGGLLRDNQNRLSDVLGLFAEWSGAVPSIRDRSFGEVCRAASEIFGWVSLLRAVVINRSNKTSSQRYPDLVIEFESVVKRAAANMRAQ